MRSVPPRRPVAAIARAPLSSALLALLAASAALHGCQLAARLTDCRTDRDCAEGRRCNPVRHLCQPELTEVCGNGVDDDLDGLGDEADDFGPCDVTPGGDAGAPPAGTCRDGTLRCRARALVCERRAQPAGSDACNDGVDDDCDGVVDNGPMCMVDFAAATPSSLVRIGSPAGVDAPEHDVCLAAFAIDRQEVSIGAFLRFLNVQPADATRVETLTNDTLPSVPRQAYVTVRGQPVALAPPTASRRFALERGPTGAWRTVERDEALLARPMVNVTWLGADAYCRWAGKHLPTEAEWWRAARGPNGQRPYPWGDPPPDCTRANLALLPDGGACAPGGTHAVGDLPAGASPEQVFALHGNVSEWMHDWLALTINGSMNVYYGSVPIDQWCARYPQGPLGPDEGQPLLRPGGDAGYQCFRCRFARGGNFTSRETRIDGREALDPVNAAEGVGFRCSRGGAPR